MTRRIRVVVSSFAFGAAALLMAIGVSGFGGMAAAQTAESVTVELDEENDSGVTGTAVLTPEGDQTLVVIELVGAEEGTEGHMFDSTCDDHRGATVFYDFNPVDADGRSETTVDAPFSELTSGEYWIHLHEPAVERGGGLVCGQVTSLRVGGTTVPSTGVGTTAGGSDGNLPLLIGFAAASVLTAFMLHRRVRRSSFVTAD